MPSKRRSCANAASVSPKKPKLEEQELLDTKFLAEEVVLQPKSASPLKGRARKKKEDLDLDARFIGNPIPADEAKKRWPMRYQSSKESVVISYSKDSSDEESILQAKAHYTTAEVDQIVYKLNDDAHVKADDGEKPYVCQIVEMFQGVDGLLYFTAQWYYRAHDTVIKQVAYLIDNKRVFFSEIRDDNPLECLIEKLNIARIPLNVDLNVKNASIPQCNYYCDMMYLLPYSTFKNLSADKCSDGNESSSSISSDVDVVEPSNEVTSARCLEKSAREVKLLDMYSGCGAMSTGLCLGANQSGLNLVTKWAVDLNEYACKSLQLNHPQTQVRNESAEDFLVLLKEWRKLCITFNLIESDEIVQEYSYLVTENNESGDEEENDSDDEGDDGEVFEVEKVLSICYGDPKETKERGLHFKIRWKGYGEDEDTWEPIDGLGSCPERIREFVVEGYNSNLLPLSGDVDVLCGGPPCQGISGFNRFRDKDNPLADEKNKQLLVYMDIVDFLKPKFVLMENVVDLIKFSNGFLGRYALARLIQMNYQVRLGMMAAGAYGLPQFRMRCFLWGAQPSENLPQYPLPTHDVVVRGVIPLEFEPNTVAYNEGHTFKLEKKLFLEDALSDLPNVGTYEKRDEMPYNKDPQTDFQRFIRLTRDEMTKCLSNGISMRFNEVLYDHRPLELNSDDYKRVCRIPKKKGANFRDLPGVRVRADNKVEWDPDVPRVYLDSGKPLVPDYAMTFVNGTSSKPFARLWWDETVPTVVTRAEPHNQAILHPVQDRVLTIRENARLQGFPDYYKLVGPIKERYIQVGNAVAVPVARALGHALALAFLKISSDDPLIRLPSKFIRRFDYDSSTSEADA